MGIPGGLEVALACKGFVLLEGGKRGGAETDHRLSCGVSW